MKYIEVIDTAYYEKNDCNNSFIVAVSEDEYESLKSDLERILSNQEDYENVWDAMMECIEEHGAERICPDFSLEW
ncbi:MAG: hypothetical protein J6T10_05010 [Methanobrevibacter sp.]|nr:hypothetical protein [Methanobrevibacter sp.]